MGTSSIKYGLQDRTPWVATRGNGWNVRRMLDALSVSAMTPGAGLQRALLSVARQAVLDLARGARENPEHAIHQLRVRMKKLRALLLLVDPDGKGKSLAAIRTKIGLLKRAFADIRDQSVSAYLMAQIPTLVGPHRPVSIQVMKSRLRQQKRAANALVKQLGSLRLDDLRMQDIASACTATYAKARRWYRRCEDKGTVERLHRWRKPVKAHYYQSLLLLRDRKRCHAWRKLGRLLGKVHDFAMLEDRVQQIPGTLGLSAIQRQSKTVRVQVFHLAQKCFTTSRKALKKRIKLEHGS